jgi:hypothetical protein
MPASASMLFAGCFIASFVPAYQAHQTSDYLEGSRQWYCASLWYCAAIGLMFDRTMAYLSGEWTRIAIAAGLVIHLAVQTCILVANNRAWKLAGDVTKELVDRIELEGPGDIHFLKFESLLDTYCGAYTFRQGLSSAISRPFATQDHDLYGWLPGMSLQDPPVRILSVFDAVREKGSRRNPKGQRIHFLVRQRLR